MLHPDISPAVEEGEADGAAGGVPQTAAGLAAAAVSSTMASIPRPWTIVTARP